MNAPYPFAAFAPPIREQSALRQAITAAYRRAESDCVGPLLEQARVPVDVADDHRQPIQSGWSPSSAIKIVPHTCLDAPVRMSCQKKSRIVGCGTDIG